MPETGLTRKVLIITYYWPPAGGPGVQRVLKFAKYLPEFGWEPIILTVENGEYPALDESLLKDVSPDIRIYRTRTLEPFQLYKLLNGQKKGSRIDNYVLKNKRFGLMSRLFKWIRFNLFIPDARVGWVPFAVRKGMQILKEESIDVIFSSSPPHSLQLAAMRLARKSKKPWVADFRDPWSSIVYYQDEERMKMPQRMDNMMEGRVLRSSDRVITVSHEISKDLNKIGHRNDTSVIYNGYDADDFKTTRRDETPTDKIVVTYAGFLSDTRIPSGMLEVLSKNLNGSLDHIEFHIYGQTSQGFDLLVKKLELEEKIIYHGYVDHTNLVQNLCQSDALLMVVDNVSDNKGILTGKLFDYMGTKRPIIAIGPENGEVEKIIKETSSGWYIEYGDQHAMRQCLKELSTGSYDFKFRTEAFERKNLTRKLATVLNQVTKK